MKSALACILTLCCLAASSAEPEEVDFATLSGFEYKEGMEVPKSVAKFHEKKIVVKGFMTSEDEDIEGDVEYFVIINDACGCEGTPKLNEMIFCAMPEGVTTPIKPGTATVTGTFYIGEEKEEGVVVSFYTMAVDTVE